MSNSKLHAQAFLILATLSGCTLGIPVAEQAVEFVGKIPSPPENSDHGYLVEDERIPTLPDCSEWERFWDYDGPAVSFSVAEENGWIQDLEVSTEIYMKNRHLDSNGDGILCEAEEESPSSRLTQEAASSLAENFGVHSWYEAKESPFSLPLPECQLQKGPENSIGIGFPRSDELIASRGQVRGIMLFVEFLDVKISTSIEDDFELFSRGFVNFYERNSYGKLDIDLDYFPEPIQIPKKSDVYGMQIWSRGDEVQYLMDAVAYSERLINYSDIDFVVVIPPNNVSEIVHGPAVPILDISEFVNAPNGKLLAGVLGGSDFRKSTEWGWYWLAHEFGHLLGMGHPYQGSAVPWDLMDNNFSQLAPDLYGWHRFQNDWLSDQEVLCLNPSKILGGQPVVLKPLNSGASNIKLVLARTSPNDLIAIEYRTADEQNPLDKRDSGILVYHVNSTSGFEGGISQILPNETSRLGVGKEGTSFEHDGVFIEIGSISEYEAFLQVSNQP